MTNDIVARLREADISGHGQYSALVREAATEIERLRIVERLREAERGEEGVTNPIRVIFQNAVWQEAFDLYERDCGGKLWEAPKAVQESYKERARKALSEYLATCGIV